jgi:hypothetical protein
LKVLNKSLNTGLDWLNLSLLSNSDGYKVELYPSTEVNLSDYLILFHQLFSSFKDEITIGQLGHDPEWGDFCLDTWDIKNDKYDYSAENKTEASAKYLQLLIDSEIEFEYKGFCTCDNWDEFLPIITQCIIKHTAPYSPIFIIPEKDFAIYLHHTMSFGIYFKQENDSLKRILSQASKNNLIVKNNTFYD